LKTESLSKKDEIAIEDIIKIESEILLPTSEENKISK
jgi:hypothetical protein